MFTLKIAIYFPIFLLYFGISLGQRRFYNHPDPYHYISIRDITVEDIIEVPDSAFKTHRNLHNLDVVNSSLVKKSDDSFRSDSIIENLRNFKHKDNDDSRLVQKDEGQSDSAFENLGEFQKNDVINSHLAKKDDSVLTSYLKYLNNYDRGPHHSSYLKRKLNGDLSPSNILNRSPSSYESKQSLRKADSKIGDQKTMQFLNQNDQNNVLRSKVYNSPNLAEWNVKRHIHKTPMWYTTESNPILKNVFSNKYKRFGSFNKLEAIQNLTGLRDFGNKHKKSAIDENYENHTTSIFSTMETTHQMASTDNLQLVESNTLDPNQTSSNPIKASTYEPLKDKNSEIAELAVKNFLQKMKENNLTSENDNSTSRLANVFSKNNSVTMDTKPNLLGATLPNEKVKNVQKKNLLTTLKDALNPFVSTIPKRSDLKDSNFNELTSTSKSDKIMHLDEYFTQSFNLKRSYLKDRKNELTSTSKSDIAMYLDGDFSQSVSRHKKALVDEKPAGEAPTDDGRIIVLVLGAMAIASVCILVGVGIVYHVSNTNTILEDSLEEGPVEKQSCCQRLRHTFHKFFGWVRKRNSSKRTRKKSSNDSQDRKTRRKNSTLPKSIIRSKDPTYNSQERPKPDDSYFELPPYRHNKENDEDNSSVVSASKSVSMPMLSKDSQEQQENNFSDINSKTSSDFASLPSLPSVSSSSSSNESH